MKTDNWKRMKEYDLRGWLPSKPGIYFLFYDDELIYIGETKNIRNRLSGHTQGKIKTNYNRVFYFTTYISDKKRKKLEAKYIEDFAPKRNGYNYWWDTVVHRHNKRTREKLSHNNFNLINPKLDFNFEVLEGWI